MRVASRNPVNSTVSLEIRTAGTEINEIQVYDIQGRRVAARKVTGPTSGRWQTELNMGNQPAGVYFIRGVGSLGEPIGRAAKVVIAR